MAEVFPAPWTVLRNAPRLVWGLVVLNGLFLLCWSILVPIYHAPDEPNHVDAAVRLYEGLGWPPPSNDVFMTPDGLSSWVASPYSRPSQPLVLNPSRIFQSEVVPRGARVPWNELRANYPPPRSNPKQLQQMVQHPPLYYAINAAVLRVVPGADSMRWDLWVGLMRLTSIVLATLLPLVLWAAAVAFTGDRRAGLVAALLPFAIPQLSHITSVVNNDAAVILFASLATLGLVCVLRGNQSRSNAIFLGVVTGLALLSKSLALVLVPMIVAAYLLRPAGTGEPDLRKRLGALRPAGILRSNTLLALVVAFVCGGWWYAFQLARTGHVQPQPPDFPGGFPVRNRLEFFDNVWQLMVQRYWGSIGWYEVNIPFRYAALGTLVVGALVVFALVRPTGTRRRLNLLLLLWPTVSVLVLVVANSYGFYQHYGRVLGLQGRYLFLGIGGLAVVLAVAVRSLPVPLRRAAPLVVATLAVLIQAETVRLVVNTFWKPHGQGLRQAWGAVSAYAVCPPVVLEVTVGLTLIAAVVVTVALVRSGRTADA